MPVNCKYEGLSKAYKEFDYINSFMREVPVI